MRFALFILGITFAVVLMFVQLGFRNALLDSNTQLHDKLRADLILVSPSRQTLAMRQSFPRHRLSQVASVTGVREVHPLYIESGLSMLRDTNTDPARRGPNRVIRVIGVDPRAHLIDLPELDPAKPDAPVHHLEIPNYALYDRRSKADAERPGETIYGPLEPNTTTELTGREIRLMGGFDLGTDFTADGNLIVSDRTFLSVLRAPYTMTSPGSQIDLGLVRLESGVDREAVRAAIERELATGENDPDVYVLTREQFKQREQQFWLNNTPIGFAFGFGMFMGFAVGLVICYQILSGDVSDHLPEYATMKAIGYGNLHLTWVVLQEALILAFTGFLPGLLISSGVYAFMTATTGLPMRMNMDRLVMVFVATVVMCSISGLLALINLLRADPADVF